MRKSLELGNETRTGYDINNRLYGWWKEVKNYFWEDTKGAARMMVKILLEECLKVELSNKIGYGYNQRRPLEIDKRNGFYMRGLGTEMGHIEQIRVPRPRAGGFSCLWN